jgi:hypothetical protein
MKHEPLGERLHSLVLEDNCRQVVLATEHDLEGFEPECDDCHGNAKKWVDLHPRHKIVRGFLVVNDCIFNKHSVIDTGSMLLDITPHNPNESRNLLRFVEFDGGNRALFEAMPNVIIWQPSFRSDKNL